MTHFFSNDGSYGDAEDLLIVDTDNWTDEDWRDIDDASDLTRLDIAKDIAERHQREQEILSYSNAYK
jgi:hypothetical protein